MIYLMNNFHAHVGREHTCKLLGFAFRCEMLRREWTFFGGMVGARHSNDGGLSLKTGSACARGENLLFI